MSVLRWPYQIEDIRSSAIPIRQKGLVGWWPAGTNPEYPDNPAGVTYFNNNFTGSGSPLDGWTAGDCTLTTSGGKLIMTATAANPRIFRAAVASRDVRLKIRRVSGNGVASRIVNSGGTLYSNDKTYPSSGEHIHDFLIGAGAAGNTSIYGAIAGSAIGDVYEISFIYIGTGAYLANSLLDLSGSGNHGTVYGATPVDTPYGRGLSGDGVNDSVAMASGMPAGDMTFSMWFRSPKTGSATQYILGRNSAGTIGGVTLGATNTINFFSRRADGTTTAASTIPAASWNADTWYHIVAIQSGLTTSMYLNGVLIDTDTHADIYTSFLPDFRLFSSPSGALPALCTIAQPRIYNRALSPEEVMFQFLHPELYQAVPQYPQQDGFGEQPQDGTIRSMMDSGPAKTRQRFTALTTQYQLTYQVNDFQKQVLDGFYRYVTRGGSLAFEWPHPVGYNEQARFLRPPSYTPNGPEYIASVALEVLP